MPAINASPGPRLRVLGTRGAYVVEGLDGQEDALRSGRRPDDSGGGGGGAGGARRWRRSARPGGGRTSGTWSPSGLEILSGHRPARDQHDRRAMTAAAEVTGSL